MGGKSSKSKGSKEDGRGDEHKSRSDRKSNGDKSRSGSEKSRSKSGVDKNSKKQDDKLPAVKQVIGSWETGLTNCSAMTLDDGGAQIIVAGTKTDKKNVIRIYDLQGNIVSEANTTDNNAVRGLTVVRRGSERGVAIIYHQPAFKPATIEIRSLTQLDKSTLAYNANSKPAEEICPTSRGLVFLNADKSPKFKSLTELFWASDDGWKLKTRLDKSSPLTITTDDKNTPLGAVFGLGSMSPSKDSAELTLVCVASYSNLAAYSLQATGSGRASWELRAAPPSYRLSEGVLRYPCDICPFGTRTCLVVDQSLNNVSMFNIEGQGSFLKVVAGEKEKLDKPRGVGFLQAKSTLCVLNKEGAEIKLFQIK